MQWQRYMDIANYARDIAGLGVQERYNRGRISAAQGGTAGQTPQDILNKALPSGQVDAGNILGVYAGKPGFGKDWFNSARNILQTVLNSPARTYGKIQDPNNPGSTYSVTPTYTAKDAYQRAKAAGMTDAQAAVVRQAAYVAAGGR